MLRFFKKSLQGKVSILTLLASLIPLLLLGVFSYVLSVNITEQKSKQMGMDTLSRIKEGLQFIIHDVESMSIFVSGQQEIQKYISGFDANPENRPEILGMMMNLIHSKDYISNISIYSKNRINPLHSTSIYESGLAHVMTDWDIDSKLWTGLYQHRTLSGQENVISFLRPLRSMDHFEQLGFVAITIKEQALQAYLTEPGFGNGEGTILLLDAAGHIVSGNSHTELNRKWEELYPGSPPWRGEHGSFAYGDGNEGATVLYHNLAPPGWTLVGIIPTSQYRVDHRGILLLTGIAVGLATVLSTLLILFFLRHVTKPVKILSRLLSKIDPNEPMPLYSINSSNEIGQLVASYNRLGSHIKQLKEQIIHLESRKKEADMRALQAQINPHFLYNTLSSIHWIALMSEEKKIADMVGALSDFLRFSLNKGKDYCTVLQEISHIKNYALIQSIRYPDQFDMIYDIEPEVLPHSMLKLLLQPLVENAMIHGIQKKEGRGMIHIYIGQEGGWMNITVQDNGLGIPEDVLSRIHDGLLQPVTAKEATAAIGYGLNNVNERLVLHYGPESRLHIFSEQGKGTEVSFAIPIRPLQKPESAAS
ncbi:sensor histidine kinase [Paenibacillus senegalensis]|uniref:sensor histidine kinase n=1 Tax=Paenibacillus senegalensis TaxID=1465766 RepID=UPI000288D30B|nr:sensor histidine kinase [Paenibacillus senegalensis]